VHAELQRGVDECAAQHGHYGRHIYLGIHYAGHTSTPLEVHIAGARIRDDLRRCIDKMARSFDGPLMGPDD